MPTRITNVTGWSPKLAMLFYKLEVGSGHVSWCERTDNEVEPPQPPHFMYSPPRRKLLSIITYMLWAAIWCHCIVFIATLGILPGAGLLTYWKKLEILQKKYSMPKSWRCHSSNHKFNSSSIDCWFGKEIWPLTIAIKTLNCHLSFWLTTNLVRPCLGGNPEHVLQAFLWC